MNDEPINIICLYWVGDFRGRDFTENDVWRLKENVDKHLLTPYNFYCLTNDMTADVPGTKIQLRHNWPGWWSKMELHRPDLPYGRTLYIDLDTHIVNDLTPVFDCVGDLVMFTSPYKGKPSATSNTIFWYQAAVMLFTPTKFAWLYAKFCQAAHTYMELFRSDQDLMAKWIPDQPTFPSAWLKKLSTFRNSRTSIDNAIFITGQPKDCDFRKPNYTAFNKSKTV